MDDKRDDSVRASRQIADEIQAADWFFRNTEDLFVVLSLELRLQRINPAWESVTGWTCAELLGQSLPDLLDDESCASALEAAHALGQGDHAPLALRLRRKAGGWVRLEGQARLGPRGEIMGTLRDLTAERERDEALGRATQEQSYLSETAGVGAWTFDPRVQRVVYSDEMLALLTRLGVILSDQRDFELVGHPDDMAVVQKTLGAAVTRGQPGSYLHRVRKADGRFMWARAHLRPEAIGDGRYLVRGMTQDVTELVEAREAAVSSERQIRRMIEEAPFAVAQFDKDLRFASVSPSWIETFDMRGSDFLGRRLDELAPGHFREFTQVQEAALAGESTSAGEQRTVDSRGVVRWLNWETRPWRDGSGEIVGVVVYVNDVSATAHARSQAEAQAQRLKVALDAADAAVIEIDYKDRTLWSSPRLEAIFGRQMSFDEARQSVWPLVHEDDAPRVRATVRSWVGGAAPEPLEARIRRLDGEERWIRIYTEIETGPDGRWRRTISLVMDIDERKRQELALMEAEKAAQAAAEAKSNFLANMSHEIRTPMNGVLGILHLLKGRDLPSEDAALVGEALACGAMLQALLDDVVDFSKVEAGRVELANEPLEPRGTLDAVAALIGPQAESKGLALIIEADGLPAWVMGDPTRLRQCLFNLVGNAVKFTAKGSVTVRGMVRETAEGLMLRYEVTDTGIGISADAQARLFQRFQQADASTTRRFGGSGLGLAITRGLAEQMGGGAGVSSVPGEGSTFWFEIAACLTAAPAADETSLEDLLEGLRILVVEDNATNRLVASKMLESLGAVVETAQDGEHGVTAAAHSAYDLILMDVNMPGIDGMEATRRIRTSGGPQAQVPIIALTANVMTHHTNAYLTAGMNGVVGKPISPSALIRAIAALDEPAGPAALTA